MYMGVCLCLIHIYASSVCQVGFVSSLFHKCAHMFIVFVSAQCLTTVLTSYFRRQQLADAACCAVAVLKRRRSLGLSGPVPLSCRGGNVNGRAAVVAAAAGASHVRQLQLGDWTLNMHTRCNRNRHKILHVLCLVFAQA